MDARGRLALAVLLPLSVGCQLGAKLDNSKAFQEFKKFVEQMPETQQKIERASDALHDVAEATRDLEDKLDAEVSTVSGDVQLALGDVRSGIADLRTEVKRIGPEVKETADGFQRTADAVTEWVEFANANKEKLWAAVLAFVAVLVRIGYLVTAKTIGSGWAWFKRWRRTRRG